MADRWYAIFSHVQGSRYRVDSPTNNFEFLENGAVAGSQVCQAVRDRRLSATRSCRALSFQRPAANNVSDSYDRIQDQNIVEGIPFLGVSEKIMQC